MPEWLIPLFICYLIYLKLTMKNPKTPTEKPAPKAKTEQVVPPAAAETKLKKPSPAKESPKKSEAAASTPEPKAKVEQPVATVAEKVNPEKPSPKTTAPKKTKAATPKPVTATAEIPVPERVGLTAGSIWHFLDENGPTPVSKLVSELPEEEKIIQRSIGWLAQEGKITLETIDKVETIGLKG